MCYLCTQMCLYTHKITCLRTSPGVCRHLHEITSCFKTNAMTPLKPFVPTQGKLLPKRLMEDRRGYTTYGKQPALCRTSLWKQSSSKPGNNCFCLLTVHRQGHRRVELGVQRAFPVQHIQDAGGSAPSERGAGTYPKKRQPK